MSTFPRLKSLIETARGIPGGISAPRGSILVKILDAGLVAGLISVVGLFPLAIISLYCLMVKEWRLLCHKNFLKALGVMVLISTPWYILAFNNDPPLFFDELIYRHLFQRLTTELGADKQALFWYIDVLAYEAGILFFLLIPLLVILLISVHRKYLRENVSFFLVFAGLACFLIITAARTKHHWYVLPLYPLAALVIGQAVVRAVHSRYHHFLYVFPLTILIYWHMFTPWQYDNDYSHWEKDVGIVIGQVVPEGETLVGYRCVINAQHFYSDRTIQLVDTIETLKAVLARRRGSERGTFVPAERNIYPV